MSEYYDFHMFNGLSFFRYVGVVHINIYVGHLELVFYCLTFILILVYCFGGHNVKFYFTGLLYKNDWAFKFNTEV